jgi:hypothetical protein
MKSLCGLNSGNNQRISYLKQRRNINLQRPHGTLKHQTIAMANPTSMDFNQNLPSLRLFNFNIFDHELLVLLWEHSSFASLGVFSGHFVIARGGCGI